jgi:hypothetical protein
MDLHMINRVRSALTARGFQEQPVAGAQHGDGYYRFADVNADLYVDIRKGDLCVVYHMKDSDCVVMNIYDYVRMIGA